MNITFTHPSVEPDEHRGTDKETRYQPARSYDLPDTVARLWLARGCAYLSPKDTVAEKPAEAVTELPPAKSFKPKLTLKSDHQPAA
jgi:hypothetical protein